MENGANDELEQLGVFLKLISRTSFSQNQLGGSYRWNL